MWQHLALARLAERLRRDFGLELEQQALRVLAIVVEAFERLLLAHYRSLVRLVAGPVTADVRGCPVELVISWAFSHNTAELHTSIRYSIARSGLLYAARRARITCSRSKPIAIISLTAFCKAEPVTNEGSLETVPDVGAGVSGGAGVSAAGAAWAGVVSVAGAAAGVDGAAGFSEAGAAGALDAAAGAELAEVEAVVAGVAFGCRHIPR